MGSPPKGKKTGTGVKKRPSADQRSTSEYWTRKFEREEDEKRLQLIKYPNNLDIVDLFKSENIPVYKRGEDDYQRATAHANLLFRFLRPACVVRPESSAQVQYIVKEAKSQNIPITIKNGGHSYAGSSTTNKCILLDLAKMNKVDLDMESMTMTIQGGALWGNAYKELIKGRHDGYVVNGGRCPTVGVSGFVLGGGIGPFTRSFGMGCDTLKEATIVTADTSVVTVKDTDDPESPEGKLFWALCGAGGGNFGVVVELKIAVQKLQNKDGIVVSGRFLWTPEPEDKGDFLTTMNRFYATNWPNQMTIDSTWLCDLRPQAPDFQVRFIAYYDGNKHDFNNQINKSIVNKELAGLFERRITAEKSSQFLRESLEGQWTEETKKAYPESKTWTIYSSFVFENDQATMERVTAIVQQELESFRERFRGNPVLARATFIHAGGKATEKQSSDTAFRWREAVYHAYIQIEWDDKWIKKDMENFCKTFKARLRPFSMLGRAAFVNFPDGALGPNAHERAYYGGNRNKLQQVKQLWDKDNFFDWARGVRLPQPNKSTSPIAVKFPAGARGERDGESTDEEFSGEEVNADTVMTDAQQWEDYALPPTNDFVGMHGKPYWWWV